MKKTSRKNQARPTEPKSLETKRQAWLDLVRVLAIFLMVLLHVAAYYVADWSGQSKISWLIANGFDSFSRICVPWLLMVSGALLLPQLRTGSWLSFYRRRLIRLVQPWLFWSVIFGWLNWWQGNEAETWYQLVVSTVWTGFWLLPVFLGLYAAAPWWQWLVNRLSPFGCWLVVIIGLAVLMAGVHWPLYGEYFVYFLLGELLARLSNHRVFLVGSLVGWIVGWLATMFLTWQLFSVNSPQLYTYYEYNAWPVVLMAISGFTFFAQLKSFWQKKLPVQFGQRLAALSAVSFQLYFIHLLFFRPAASWLTSPSLIFIPVYTMMIFGLSWLGVKLIQRSRLLSKLSGAEERT